MKKIWKIKDNSSGVWISDPYEYAKMLKEPNQELVAWVINEQGIKRPTIINTNNLKGYSSLNGQIIKETKMIASNLKPKQKYTYTGGADIVEITYLGKTWELPELKARSSMGKGHLFKWPDGSLMELGRQSIEKYIESNSLNESALPEANPKTSNKIFKVLEGQKFDVWYKKDFADFISQKPEAKSEEQILNDIRILFDIPVKTIEKVTVEKEPVKSVGDDNVKTIEETKKNLKENYSERIHKYDGESELFPGTILKLGKGEKISVKVLQDLGDKFEAENDKGETSYCFKEDYAGALIESPVSEESLNEGTWALPKSEDVKMQAIEKLTDFSREYFSLIGDDELFNHLDAAIERIKELPLDSEEGSEKLYEASSKPFRIEDKDWERMLDLVLTDKSGEGVANTIKDKNKAIARFIAGTKLKGEKVIFDSIYRNEFASFAEKALYLGATKDEIKEYFEQTEIPAKFEEKLTQNSSKFNSSYTTEIVKVVLKMGHDIEISKGGNAMTQAGRHAMSYNGRNWTIGYKSIIKVGDKELVFNFDAITDEGSTRPTLYVLESSSDEVFKENVKTYKNYGIREFLKILIYGIKTAESSS